MEALRNTLPSPQLPSKTILRIAAVQIFFHHLLNDRPEVAILSFEAALIFHDKLLKIMKEHPVKVGAFRMTLAIDPGHSRRDDS